MSTEQHKYGTVTVGTGEQIPIESWVSLKLKDDRIATCAKLVDEKGYILKIENPNAGKVPVQTMWLTEESLIGVTGAAIIHMKSLGKDLGEEIVKATGSPDIQYSYSQNLKPIQDEA